MASRRMQLLRMAVRAEKLADKALWIGGPDNYASDRDLTESETRCMALQRQASAVLQQLACQLSAMAAAAEVKIYEADV